MSAHPNAFEQRDGVQAKQKLNRDRDIHTAVSDGMHVHVMYVQTDARTFVTLDNTAYIFIRVNLFELYC